MSVCSSESRSVRLHHVSVMIEERYPSFFLFPGAKPLALLVLCHYHIFSISSSPGVLQVLSVTKPSLPQVCLHIQGQVSVWPPLEGTMFVVVSLSPVVTCYWGPCCVRMHRWCCWQVAYKKHLIMHYRVCEE
jgi:hypothetical protein